MSSQKLLLKGKSKPLPEPELSVGQLFYKTLKSCPIPHDAASIDFNSGSALTFGDFFEKSAQLAQGLRNLGFRKNDIVAIISRNRHDYFIPFLACTYLGVSLNLLNPDYTKRELQHAFGLCTPVAVIVCSEKFDDAISLQKEFPAIERVINFDEWQKYLAKADHFVPDNSLENGNSVFAILSSSGTTGLPKAVAITNDNFRYALQYCVDTDYLEIDRKHSHAGILPYYHIFGALVFLGTLYAGGKTVCLVKFSPSTFLQAIQMHKITKLIIVPSVAVFLVKSELTYNYDLSSVQDIICGGAPLRLKLQEALEQKLGVFVRQTYGMTEVTGAITVSPRWSKSTLGNSGTLVCNNEAKFVDLSTGKLLGPNELGECCYKGPTVMKGYVGNEKSTMDLFDDEGFLHSGDVGYYDENHFIFIVDRIKELIKYKGFQVPPAELENVLLGHSEIKEAVVIGIEDERAGELPRALVVKAEGSSLTEDQVKEYAAKQLCIQKQLHGGVQFVEGIPKNEMGKVLRKELKQLIEF